MLALDLFPTFSHTSDTYFAIHIAQCCPTFSKSSVTLKTFLWLRANCLSLAIESSQRPGECRKLPLRIGEKPRPTPSTFSRIWH